MDNGLARAQTYLQERGYGDRIHLFKESTATVALAAEQVGVEEARIAKTLSFYDGGHDGHALVIVAAGDAKMDNRRFKDTFGFKGKMLRGEDVEAYTGYAPGGVCPFALSDQVAIYLDASLDRFDIVYPACGNAASAVRLTIAELEALTGTLSGQRVDVCKGWREEA